MPHSYEFPALPPASPDNGPWSANIFRAHKRISDSCAHTQTLLRDDEADPLRVKIHIERLTNDCLPILEAMEDAEYDIIPAEWIEEAAVCLGSLVGELSEALRAATAREGHNVSQIEPITIEHTRKRGRPRKVVDCEYLKEAMSSKRNITIGKLSSILGIHRNTLREYMKRSNVTKAFHKLSNHDLDLLVKVFKAKKPDSGVQYLIGFLRSHGLRVQRRRLVASLHRTDRLGRTLREKATIHRRTYRVPRPNSLWHVDGHHKLILWGFVIHGIIDGFSRLVTSLRASTNNRAATVLELFLQAVLEYGTPSRVRGDRGGENMELAVWMIMHRGPNRASFMWGSSTRNTRIERLWVEVGTQFARSWRAFFTRLERLHGLDRTNPHHLWLLHRLFLDMLNEDCEDFRKEWNAKPLRNRESRNCSPDDMFLLGQTEHGVYVDDYDNIHPDILNRYLGAHGREVVRPDNQVGAGHDPAEEDEPGVLETVAGEIAAHQEHNVRHDPIEVPDTQSPFVNGNWRAVFEETIQHVCNAQILPEGLGVRADEWNDEGYPAYEKIQCGSKGRKSLIVPLPDWLWRPRAELWTQGLEVLTHVMEFQADSEAA